jgi:acetyl esterase/lipase
MCVGDSAGGNLVTNIVQQAIWNGVRVPDLLALVYAPLLLGLSLSPSRLISAMDPLINMSIMWRCLAAYYGVQEGGKDRAKTKTSQSQRPRVLKYPGIISEATVDVIEALYTHELTTNELVSPLISSDSVLEKFPATFLIVCNLFILMKISVSYFKVWQFGIYFIIFFSNKGM